MVTINKYLIRSFGGVNFGADPTAIGDNEFENIENFYPFAQMLRRRNGITLVTGGGAWTQNVLSMFAYKEAVGTWTLLTFGETGVGKLSGSSVADVPALSGAFTSATGRYSAKQYKNITYFCRKSNGSLFRTDGTAQGAAGIDAPTTAPVLAEGAAGDLGAGDYIGVVTFYNSATGAESNPSPLSNTITIGASKKIDWTAIPTSTNPQVDQRRCYRTLVGQSGEYYHLVDITDNTTVILTEEVLQDDMGNQVSFDNGVPPSTCAHLAVWNERVWPTDEVDLFFSEFGLPESFSEFSVIGVSPDDGAKINGLLAFGDLLLVGKTNAMYYIVGTDESDFALQTLSDRFGCVSQQSMATAEGKAFWFGGQNFYKTDGNQVLAIGDIHVRTIVDGIDPAYYHLVNGAIDDTRSWYIVGIPADGASTITMYLVYNYRDDSWTTFTWTATAPQIIGDFYDTNGQGILYAGIGTGNIYTFNTGTTDIGVAIPAVALTKRFGIDTDDMVKFVRDAGVHATSVDEDITVAVFGDGVSLNSMTINLGESQFPWTTFALSSRGKPATYLQLKFTYNGTRALDLKGYQMKVIDLGRRGKKVT